MCNPISSIGNAIGGVTHALLGGGSSTQADHNTLPQNTQNDLQDLLAQYQAQQNSQSTLQWQDQQNERSEEGANQGAQDVFRQHLTSFLSADHGPNPTPEQLAQATNFVDQTFTKPMQNQIDQYNARFQDSSNANAAAMGRAPGTDQATQQAVYTSGLQNLYNLQAQRGSQIQNTAQNLNQQDFSRQNQALQTGYYGNAAMNQNSQFLNNLTQQAFGNQMTLANGRSGLGNFWQNQSSNRSIPGGAGILGTIQGIGSGISGALSSIGGASNSIGGMFSSSNPGGGGNTGGGSGPSLGVNNSGVSGSFQPNSPGGYGFNP